MSIRSRLLLLCVCGALHALPAAAQTATLFVDSQPGDYVGNGGRETISLPVSAVRVSIDGNHHQILIQSPNWDWSLWFGGPWNAPLAPGMYDDAATISADPVRVSPGLMVFTSGRVCGTVIGRFQVYELAFDAAGNLIQFAVDFEQHCGGATPALFGALRYNAARASLVPFDGAYPDYSVRVQPQVNGSVSGSAIDCGAGQSACTEAGAADASLTLHAAPSPGYVFLGWNHADCVGDDTLTVTLRRGMHCVPVFNSTPGSGVPEVPDYSCQPGTFCDAWMAALYLDGPLGTGEFTPAPGARIRQVYAGRNALVVNTSQSPDAVVFRIVGFRDTSWQLTIAAPHGQPLAPGSYTAAASSASQRGNATPLLTLTGSGGTCGTGGRFLVHENGYGSDGVWRFAADFALPCGPESVLQTGAIRYHAARASLLPFDGQLPGYSLEIEPSLGGYVLGSGFSCGEGGGTDCTRTSATPWQATLEAFSSPGYTFMGWSGDCAGTAASTAITVTASRRCFASFAPTAGSRAPTDPAIRAGALLLMFPDGMPGQPTSRLWTANGDAITFERLFSFAASAAGQGGTGSVRFESWPGIGSPQGGVYDEAYSSPTQDFARLIVGGCAPSRGRFVVYEVEWAPDGNATRFTADFEATCQTSAYHVVGAVRFNSTRDTLVPFDGAFLTHKLVVRPAINGVVSGDGLLCGPGYSDCAETYPNPRAVTLQASPLPGYRFGGWSGDCEGRLTTTVFVDFAARCSAIFNSIRVGTLPEDPSLARHALLIDSRPGDGFADGRQFARNDVNVIAIETVSEGAFVIQADFPGFGAWTLAFRTPASGAAQPVLPGTYSVPQAGLTITGPDARCEASSGRFVVYEVTFAWFDYYPRPPRPKLIKFAADFEVWCGGSAAPLTGSIRMGSSRSEVVPFPEVLPPAPIVNADINADGWPDLVWRHATSGQNAFWLMNGVDLQSSAYLQPASASVVPAPDWQIRAMADLNGDGRPDLIWQNAANGQHAVWYVSGTTCIGTDYIYGVAGQIGEFDLNWQIVAAGDANRDGYPDLFWRNTATGDIRLWHMYGARQVDSVAVAQVTDLQWNMAAVADMDGDGWLDLIWRHNGNGGLATWTMQDRMVLNTLWLAPVANPDTAWQIVGAADMNRDGHIDLIWQHVANGQLGVWFMRGLEMVWARHLNPWMVPDLDWRVVAVR